MSTMTDETTTAEPQFQTPPNSVLFMARRKELQLVKTPSWAIRDPRSGQVTGETPGEMIRFVDGVFRCPRDGTVTFADGATGDAAESLAWLEAHLLNGDLHEGFWAVPEVAPAPSQGELDMLMQMSVGLDIEGLETFIGMEQAGYGREQLIKAAETSIAQIKAMHGDGKE